MTAGTRRAVFLDRDGVLNALVVRQGRLESPLRLEEFRIAEGAGAVRRLRTHGLLVFVVTNQPEVSRGNLKPADLDAMHEILRTAVDLDDIAICPHDDAARCACRKPEPGMLLALAERWDVDLARSFVVGDTWRDAEAGRRAGCRTILVPGDRRIGREPDMEVSSLEEAVTAIEASLGADGGGGHGLRS